MLKQECYAKYFIPLLNDSSMFFSDFKHALLDTETVIINNKFCDCRC